MRKLALGLALLVLPGLLAATPAEARPKRRRAPAARVAKPAKRPVVLQADDPLLTVGVRRGAAPAAPAAPAARPAPAGKPVVMATRAPRARRR